MKTPGFRTRLVLLLGAMLVLITTGLIFWPPLLTQADATLPPRDPPARSAPKEKDKDKDAPVGAYIELQLQSAQAGLWTVVQWQDSAGEWHNVDGWQGPPEGNGRQWWVEAKNFGKGPFRWVVTRGPGGAQAGISAPFNLPAGAGQRVQVIVVLK